MTDTKVKSQVYDGFVPLFYPVAVKTPVAEYSNALHWLDGVALEQQTLVKNSGRTPDGVENQREVFTHVAQCW